MGVYLVTFRSNSVKTIFMKLASCVSFGNNTTHKEPKLSSKDEQDVQLNRLISAYLSFSRNNIP